MLHTVGAFFSLYLATLLLLTASGLFNTYLGLRLTELSVSEVWVGGLLAAFYLGLVIGARVGHKLIIGVGHIRAYSATAAIVTVAFLVQVLLDSLWLWLILRFVAGAAMVTQFMALESWLNEQTENSQRGIVFAFYMVMTSLGTVLGQFVLTQFTVLDYRPLIFVAICAVLSLIPIALTRRLHPALQVPAPINARYYIERVPMSLVALLVAGMVTGAFYGLAPVYAVRVGLASDQAAMFVAISVAAGVIAQWPMGWLADRINRVALIRYSAVLMFLLSVPLWGWLSLPYEALLLFSAAFGVLQFTLYPLGAAFANDNVDPDRRVGLSAILYMVYGLGACLGPLLVGLVMDAWGSDAYFIFVAICCALLVGFIKPSKVTGVHASIDAPTEYVPMPDGLQSAGGISPLDPRVDVEIDISHDPITEADTEPETKAEIDPITADNHQAIESHADEPMPAEDRRKTDSKQRPDAAPAESFPS